MYKNLKRAFRRHHSFRVKQNYKRKIYWLDKSNERMVGIVSKTPRLCSCWMCGNSRKYFGEISSQEKKAKERDEFDSTEELL